ncbi:MAG: SMP-30/gluconolactonase/LRE family protein [Deltaproteobacteria bacterium]|nr:SMP-30/gluconolactonase/LRE family protein [Deltaproteobacteria bacterium]
MQGIGDVELVAEGFLFLEGPQWRDDLGALVFSDIDGDTIYSLTPPSAIEVSRTPSGKSNGLALDTDGRLLAAEHSNRRVSRTMEDGSIVTVADRYEGARLSSPNDIVVRSDGTIYFTDPPYGLADQRDRELDFNGVFRLDPAGELGTIWEGDPSDSGPNGIALSPDERMLYVSDSSQALVRAFDVHPDGTADGERIFVETSPVPDGMAMDRAGNLFVSTSAGIEVFAPDGARWGTIPVPREPANCAFAGPDAKTLYVTAVEGLYRVDLAIAGLL